MAYTPPTGSSVELVFGGAYTPPAGSSVVLDFSDSNVTGVVATTALGTVTVEGAQVAYPDGVALSADLGTVSLTGLYEPAPVSGVTLVSYLHGVTLTGLLEEVPISGLSLSVSLNDVLGESPDRSYPVTGVSAAVSIGGVIGRAVFTQHVNPTVGTLYTAFGRPFAAFELRYINQIQSSDFLGVGTPLMGERQWVLPDLLLSMTFAMPKVHFPEPIVAGNITRDAYGQAELTFGNILFPSGGEFAQVGTPALENRLQIVEAHSPDDTWYGHPTVWNLRQYVEPYYDGEWGEQLTIGRRTDARNRNMSVTPNSYTYDEFSLTNLLSKAGRPVAPYSIVGTQWGTTFVSNWRRYVYPEQVYYKNFTPRATYVYRAGVALSPVGVASESFGRPSAVKLRQYVEAHGLGFFTQFSQPWVSFGNRTLSPRSIATLSDSIGVQRVSDRIQPLLPAGFEKPQFGYPWLYIRKNEVFPHYFVTSVFGRPDAVNRNREVRLRGKSQSEFGTQVVDTWIKYVVPPPTWNAPTFGRGRVSDALQRLYPVSVQSQDIGVSRVRLASMLDDTRQYVTLAGIGPPDVIGPRVQPHPFPPSIDSLVVGTAWVRGMGIFPKWGIPDTDIRFGYPSFSPAQYISPEGAAWDEHVLHRMSPQRIWAQEDTPAQALANNPWSVLFIPLDQGVSGNRHPGPPWFGPVRVTTPFPQWVTERHDAWDGDQTMGGFFGPTTQVENKIRSLQVSSINSMRFGYPSTPFYQWVWVYPVGVWQFGTQAVANELTSWELTITPQGFTTRFGATNAELFDREVHPNGFNPTLFGNNTPMVHHPRTVTPTPFDATRYGTAWASFAPITCELEGFDAFECDYSVGFFYVRTRVWQRNASVSTDGDDETEFGDAFTSLKNNPVQPYQIPPPGVPRAHVVHH